MMSDAELKALSTEVKKLTARVEALERLLQRIIQQRPVSEKQLERALRSMKRSDERATR
jgi:DNA-binding SARP family transcriptional activator